VQTTARRIPFDKRTKASRGAELFMGRANAIQTPGDAKNGLREQLKLRSE
jgi:hypothetical protein